MSATLEIDKFSRYFDTDSVLKIEGRTFPIEVYNTIEEENNYIVIKYNLGFSFNNYSSNSYEQRGK